MRNVSLVRRVAGVFVLCVALMTAAVRASAQEEYPRDLQTQAAFFVRFIGYLEWEPGRGPSRDESIVCVLGESPLAAPLEDLVNRRGGRLRFRRFADPKEGRDCSLLFIGPDHANEVSDILFELDGSGVVTVSTLPDFLRRGGMIQFVDDDSQVRFVINQEAAERQGVRMSSQLLALAKKQGD